MKNLKYLIVCLITIVPIKDSQARLQPYLTLEKEVIIKEQRLDVLVSKIKLQIAELKYINNNKE